MPLQRFEPRRAVEITGPRYGSGYRIGSCLVLSAKHLFPDGTDSACKVRSKLTFSEIEAKVVWVALDVDIALVALPAVPDVVKDREPVVFGEFPPETDAAIVNFDLYGWPAWAQTRRLGEAAKAGGRHIVGKIYLADTSPEGLLVLEPERVAEAPDPDNAGSQWIGISGAAVICDGLVVAVQHHHQNPRRSASLEATSLSKVYDDPDWQRLLTSHGIDPKPRPVVIETIRRSNGLGDKQLDSLGLKRKPERVCFISSEYPPRVEGGLGVHVKELTRALAGHVAVDVVLPSNERTYELQDRVNPVSLEATEVSYNNPLSWFSFAQAAADRVVTLSPSPDVIHCHDWVTVLAGIQARWKLETKLRTRIPLVFHLHLPNGDLLCRSIENLGLVCADIVTVSSYAMYEDLGKRGLPLRSRQVVENGVDTTLFRPLCPDARIDDDERYILFVGRLVKQKGVEHLLRAFRYVQVPNEFKGLRLKIVGTGPILYEKWLEDLSKNLLFTPGQVQFLKWIDHGKKLVDLYQHAAVVAIPSIYEPFCIVALEAMACQRPIVASNTGGLRALVGVGENAGGYLAEPGKELDLAQGLMTLLARPDLHAKMSQAALRRVATGPYSWSKIAEKFITIYEELMATSAVSKLNKDKITELRKLIMAEAQRRGETRRVLLDELFAWVETI